MTNKQKEREKAVISGDPNRILWVLDRAVARILFQHSLNAVTASRMSDKKLLKLKGIGPRAMRAIREANSR